MGPDVMLAKPSKLSPEAKIAELSATGKWWYELKLDGVRAVIRRDPQGRVEITNRNRTDITKRFPDVVTAAMDEHDFVGTLDGEIIVADADGRPNFHAAHRRNAQSRAVAIRRLAASSPATFVPFDVLWVDDLDVRGLSYEMRRQHLLRAWGSEGVSVSSRDGAAMWAFVKERELEGLVAKLGSSVYTGKRSTSWVKLRATKRLSALVTGVAPGKGSGPIGSLYIALWDLRRHELVPVGRVGGSGMADEDLRLVAAQLAAGTPTVVEVEYLERAPSGHLRMPVFKAVRQDVPPEACMLDQI